jgi:hypothetical protein
MFSTLEEIIVYIYVCTNNESCVWQCFGVNKLRATFVYKAAMYDTIISEYKLNILCDHVTTLLLI